MIGASADNALSEDAMIGTGLSATPRHRQDVPDRLAHRPTIATLSDALVDRHRERGKCGIQLGGFARGEGPSLQDAADDLIRHLLGLVLAFRSSGFRALSEVWPDLETMSFLYELGEIAAEGGDMRTRVFG
jgi:hypothetical protein